MKADKLLRLATYFEKRADEESGINISDKVFRTPLLPYYQWSFQDVANTLFGEMNKKEDGLQDAGQSSGPVYQLMSMMTAHATPDPGRFLTLTQQIAQKAKELFPSGGSAIGLSQNLVRYAQLLINKYLAGTPTPSGSGNLQVPETTITGDKPQASQPTVPASESSYQFISRVYKQIRMGQGPSDDDRQKWPSYRAMVVRRLNGLKGMATRTPAQEQELAVLQALVDKLS